MPRPIEVLRMVGRGARRSAPLVVVAGATLGGVVAYERFVSPGGLVNPNVVTAPAPTPTPNIDERVAAAVDAALKKANVATASPTVVERVAATPTIVEADKNVMTLVKPAAWEKAPTLKLVEASSYPAFPKTAAEAAVTFGVDGTTKDASRWERTAEGDGWHLKETGEALNVNPHGHLMEGYFDTEPGHNPFSWAMIDIDGNIPAQGATFWNEQRGSQRAVKLQREMHIAVWKNADGSVRQVPAVLIIPLPA